MDDVWGACTPSLRKMLVYKEASINMYIYICRIMSYVCTNIYMCVYIYIYALQETGP